MKLTSRLLALSALLFMTRLFALAVGQQAPDFSLPNQDGKLVRLSDLKGKPVLIYFYPKDETPGCTREACHLRDAYERFQKKGATILGISRQDQKSHQEFRTHYKLPFDLLVDSDGKVGDLYGIGNYPVVGYFKRKSVLVGKDGKIVRYYDSVDPDKHADEVLKDLDRS